MARTGLRRLAVLAATVGSALGSAALAAAPSAAAATPSAPATGPAAGAGPGGKTTMPAPMVSLSGHGLGDGAGMGQWGALGYALNDYSYRSILSHFYGGTTMAEVPNSPIRVVLTANDQRDTVVSSATAFSVGGRAFPAGTAAKLSLLGSGAFALTKGASCAAAAWTPVATLSASAAVAVPSSSTAAMQLCGTGATYRGDIEATSYQGSSRTVNVVSLEDYLDSVVPAESPPYWGTLGQTGAQAQPEGFQELEAQAVAARSYVMSDLGQYGYADICDTSACQNYLGTANENPITDLAVVDTAGQVLELGSGKVANTQYSASTGGYTSGGTFPAVADPGDSICVKNACNPDHDWSTQIPTATIEAAYPSIGAFGGIEITARNGLGALGGRVQTLTLEGSRGHVDLSGADFASTLGLDSNWFSVTAAAPPTQLVGDRMIDSAGDVLDAGAAAYHGSLAGHALSTPVVGTAGTPDGAGYWLLGSGGQLKAFGDARSYGTATFPGRRFVGIAPTADGAGYWLATTGGAVYSFGDAVGHGSLYGSKIASPIVAIAPSPAGGYWLVGATGVVYSFGAARVYGSTASMHLGRPIVCIAPTSDGDGYWLLGADGGVHSFGDAHVHGSLFGSKLSNLRATTLVPTPDGGGYLIATAAGTVYHFGDAPTLVPPTPPATFHPPAVGLVGVLGPKA